MSWLFGRQQLPLRAECYINKEKVTTSLNCSLELSPVCPAVNRVFSRHEKRGKTVDNANDYHYSVFVTGVILSVSVTEDTPPMVFRLC